MIYYKHKTTDSIKIKKLPWYSSIFKTNNWHWVNGINSIFDSSNDLINLSTQKECRNILKDVVLIAKDEVFLYFYYNYNYEFGKIEIDRIEDLHLYDLHSHLNVCKNKEGIDNDIKIFLHYFMVNDLPLETHFSSDIFAIKDARDNLLQYKFSPKLLYHQIKIVDYCDKYINLHLLHDENNNQLNNPIELTLSFGCFHRYGFYKTFNLEYKGV